ncbi:MAG: CDP-glycerol glycerophosphotransferase family protein [Lachnospiraceae bacterium]|nr:CDP-glycerol glycerophosphotransferase family protein [Lachnospiraceae bacterium]
MREKIKKLTPGFLIEIYKKARYLGITALFFACRIFPIDKKLVVFCSVWGYGDNARYVANELCARKRAGKDRELKLVFVTNHPEQVPKALPIRALKTNSPAALLALSRAKVWVENNRKEAYIRKRRGQYYIQLWHGGIALKKIEGDCQQALGEEYIRRAKQDSRNTNLFVSNSTFCTQMYRRAFWAKCEIMECGSPRNDRFVAMGKCVGAGNYAVAQHRKEVPSAAPEQAQKEMPSAASEQAQKEVPSAAPEQTRKEMLSAMPKEQETSQKTFPLLQHTQKTAVYAPTYRGSRKNYCDFDADKLRAALSERFGGEWEILVRLHPLVAEGHELAGRKGIRDISAAPDLYEVLYGADVLITDYSNTMFEFSITGKPVFLYADDQEEYKKERGLYFDFEGLPFPKAASEEELFARIREYQAENYEKPLQEFFRRAGLKESGAAANAVADRIEQVVSGASIIH